jgi:hypothetical protein
VPFYLVREKPKNSEKKQNHQISLPDVEISRKKFPSPMGNFHTPVKRAAFRIFRKGSLTVEAAWALPLFLFCVLALTELMGLYKAYAVATVELQEEVEKLGMYAAAGGLQEELVIDRSRQVEYRPFWMPFGDSAAAAVCRGRVRAWTGKSGDSAGEGEVSGNGRKLVYVTEHGEVYHTTSRCSYLDLTIRQVPESGVALLRNAGGGKYHPCEKCVGAGGKNPYLYVTEQGEKYHNTLECSGLKRSVRLEELSGLEGMTECSRCSQMEGEG